MLVYSKYFIINHTIDVLTIDFFVLLNKYMRKRKFITIQ